MAGAAVKGKEVRKRKKSEHFLYIGGSDPNVAGDSHRLTLITPSAGTASRLCQCWRRYSHGGQRPHAQKW